MRKRVHIAIVLIATCAVVAIGWAGKLQMQKTEQEHAWFKAAPAHDNRIFEKVLAYRNKKDFDAAVEVALKGVGGKPPDDFLLQTVADTYFERAQWDPLNREKWVNLALKYSEEALRTNPDDLVNVFNLGESYLSAGMNLEKTRGCSYYKKSREIFEQVKASPTLRDEWGMIEGSRVQMQPYRRTLDDKIAQVSGLISTCSTEVTN
jgi:tetratricopeptide (TPR) repeat protein